MKNLEQVKIDPLKLRQARLSKGIPLTSAAKLIGVSKQHLNNLESGRVNPMGIQLARMCVLYDVPVTGIITDQTDKAA